MRRIISNRHLNRRSKVVDLKITTCIIVFLQVNLVSDRIFRITRIRDGRAGDSKVIGAPPAAVAPFPWEAIREINERVLELLVQMARSEASSVMFPRSLRDLLRQIPPEARKRAAARAYILVDLEFRNLPWWEAVKRSPEKPFAGYAGRNLLPKRSAVPLARTLLMAAREAIRADIEIARLVLGIDPQVADLLSGLQTTEIDRIAGHQFAHIEFRWLDHPAVWRSLLLSLAKPETLKERQFDAHWLQLLIGDMPNTKISRL